jgi:hypothetical protein
LDLIRKADERLLLVEAAEGRRVVVTSRHARFLDDEQGRASCTQEGGRMLRDAGKAEIYVKQRARPSTKKKKQSCLLFVVARFEGGGTVDDRPNDDGVWMRRHGEGHESSLLASLIRWESRNAEDGISFWFSASPERTEVMRTCRRDE